jgi:sugar phosphate permease
MVRGPKALCELQCYVYDAWQRMAEIYDELENKRRAKAQGFVGTLSGVGASLSTTLSSLVAASYGRAAGFLAIAAVALAALLLFWSLMPETNIKSR